jgi:hypothetical protein
MASVCATQYQNGRMQLCYRSCYLPTPFGSEIQVLVWKRKYSKYCWWVSTQVSLNILFRDLERLWSNLKAGKTRTRDEEGRARTQSKRNILHPLLLVLLLVELEYKA